MTDADISLAGKLTAIQIVLARMLARESTASEMQARHFLDVEAAACEDNIKTGVEIDAANSSNGINILKATEIVRTSALEFLQQTIAIARGSAPGGNDVPTGLVITTKS